MAGWIADFFRFAWGLFYWNGRKAFFRLRPGSRCPCQSVSDSGRAYETHCDACVMWAKPSRFRRICPLLVETPNGLRCSVNTADVRPFWGIVLRVVGTSLVAAYLLGTLAVFGGFRAIGYPVRYVSVAWPPSWRQINAARAQYFLTKGVSALAQSDFKEALFSLSYAHELAPHDYNIGFSLASLWQITQPTLSDRLYSQLLTEHPENNDVLADSWNRALLARSDYAQVKELAAAQFRRSDPAHAGYWMNALIFASRQTGDDVPLRRLIAGPGPLAPQWQRVVQAELLVRTGQEKLAVTELSRIWPEATHPFVPFFQLRSLIELRQARPALDLLAQYGSRVADDERYAVQLDAYAQLGWDSLRESTVSLLLTPRPTGPIMELLAAHLAKNPSQHLLDRVFARLQSAPLAATLENYNALIALFCAAGIAADYSKMHFLGQLLDQMAHASPLTLAAFEDFFQGKPPPRHIEAFLPSLPMSLDMTYILLGRYSTGRVVIPRQPGSSKP